MKQMYLLTYVTFEGGLVNFKFHYKLFKTLEKGIEEMTKRWGELHDLLKANFGLDEAQISSILDKWCCINPNPIEVEE